MSKITKPQGAVGQKQYLTNQSLGPWILYQDVSVPDYPNGSRTLGSFYTFVSNSPAWFAGSSSEEPAQTCNRKSMQGGLKIL